MKYKIRISNVRIRPPYYIQCHCGNIIEGFSPEMVSEEGNNRGWKYDYENDRIFCYECLEKILDKG